MHFLSFEIAINYENNCNKLATTRVLGGKSISNSLLTPPIGGNSDLMWVQLQQHFFYSLLILFYIIKCKLCAYKYKNKWMERECVLTNLL